MNLRSALAAEGYCRFVGMDSTDTGKFCRTNGVTIEEIKEFSAWLVENNDVVVLASPTRVHEKELIQKVSELNETTKHQDKELERKEKALAEAESLLVLSKKARRIWGGTRQVDQPPRSPRSR